MSTKKKALVIAIRVAAVLAMIGIPFSVISYKFPMWKAQGEGKGAFGVGAVVLVVILFVTFRKYIIAWATEKLGALSAGVSLVFIWASLAIVCMVLAKIGNVLEDLATVFLFASVGAAVGFGLLTIAKRLNLKEDDTNGKDT
jgi:membrane protease YdiL (CAAX protease family)